MDEYVYVECQTCGEIIHRLHKMTDQKYINKIAERPYDFVVYCRSCAPYVGREYIAL